MSITKQVAINATLHLRYLRMYLGKTRGAWKVIHVVPNVNLGAQLIVQCVCGKLRNKTYAASQWHSISPWSSCGCIMKLAKHYPELGAELTSVSSNKEYHGMKHTSLWGSYRAMKHRCLDPTADSYGAYGALGITVDSLWDTFIPFMQWSMENGWQEGYQIDRRDPRGNYTPSNCRWLAPKENLECKVIHHSKDIRIGNTTRKLIEWKRLLGVKDNTYHGRVHRGWSEVEALVIPLGVRRSKVHNLIQLIERAQTKGSREVPLD